MIGIVLAAYRSDARSHERWLARIVEAAHPHLDHGLGVLGFTIDTRRALERWAGSLVTKNVSRDFRSALREFLDVGFPRMPRPLLEAAFRRPTPRVAAGSEFAGGLPLPQVPFIGDFARQFGFDDSIGVRCGDPAGLGCFIGAFTPKIFRTTPSFRRRWSRIAAHLTAAMRLREGNEAEQDALFTRKGRPLQVAPRAKEHIAQLRNGVLNRERARSVRLRAHADEALELWPALVAGRWSLIDGDDDRTCRAVWNAPRLSVPVAVSRLEGEVAALIAIGHSNKLVAYELGIAEGTVSSIVHRLRRKLGAGSRAALVAACARLDQVSVADHAVASAPLAQLSPAESEVVRAAAEGLSNAAIAASRNHSVRTTENILANAYRKLGVRSRAELVARLLT